MKVLPQHSPCPRAMCLTAVAALQAQQSVFIDLLRH